MTHTRIERTNIEKEQEKGGKKAKKGQNGEKNEPDG